MAFLLFRATEFSLDLPTSLKRRWQAQRGEELQPTNGDFHLMQSWLGTPIAKQILSTCPQSIPLYSFLCKWYTCTTAVMHEVHCKAYTKNRHLERTSLKFVLFSWIRLCSLCFGNHWMIDGGVGVGARSLGCLPHIYMVILPLSSFKKYALLRVQRSSCHALLILRATASSL